MKFFKSMLQSWLAVFLTFVVVNKQVTLPTIADAKELKHGGSGVGGSGSKGRVGPLQVIPYYECATASVMSGLGDLLAQTRRHFNEQKDINGKSSASPSNSFLTIEWKRTFQFMIKGLGEGFLWTIWYRNAEHWTVAITRKLTKGSAAANSVFFTTLVATTVAILLDLTLACPFIYAAWDIPMPALMRGTPLTKIPHQIRSKIGEMLIASVMVWTPVNIVIYNLPVQYRVYVMSFTDVFWQSIVSGIVSTTAAAASILEVEGSVEQKVA